MEKSRAINKSLHPSDKQPPTEGSVELHPSPSTRLLLLCLLLFHQPKAAASHCPLPKQTLGTWHIWGAGNAESTGACREERWIQDCLVPASFFHRHVQEGAGSSSREAHRCLKLIPTSGVSFWCLRRPRSDVGIGRGVEFNQSH